MQGWPSRYPTGAAFSLFASGVRCVGVELPLPVAIRFGNVSFSVLLPGLAHPGAVIEVQLSIDDAPGLRVGRNGEATTHSVGAVATVLRRVALRVSGKQVSVGGT